MLTESIHITGFRRGLRRLGFRSRVYGVEEHLVVEVSRAKPQITFEGIVHFRGRTDKQVERSTLITLHRLHRTARQVLEMERCR